MLDSLYTMNKKNTASYKNKRWAAIDMKKLLAILYFGFIPATLFSDFFQKGVFLQKIGILQGVSNLFLVFYYIKCRKTKFINRDWYLIEALLFSCVAGILVQLYDDLSTLMFINTVGFYLTQFMYINVFRNEGSELPSFGSIYKEWEITSLSIIFGIGFLFLITKFIPDKLLVISFVYSTQMLILCWMVYFRPISRRVFIEGFVGVFLLVISNLWLTINLLVHSYPLMIFTYFMLYALSQFLIVGSILKQINSTNSPSGNPS